MSDRQGEGPEKRRRRSLAREAQAFRQAFLQRFTFPGDRECLEHLGRMLDRLTEQAPHWPDPGGSPTERLFEAAMADAESLIEVMEGIAEEREATHMSASEEAVSRRAERLAAVFRRNLSEGE